MRTAGAESPAEVWDGLLADDEGARDAVELRRWFLDREMGVPDDDGSERPLCTVLRPHLVDERVFRL